MSKLKRFGFALIYVAFTAIGLAMGLTSRGSDRIAGLGIASFFGLGGIGYWLMRHPRPTSHGVATVIRLDEQPRPALVFPLVRARMLGILCIALGFLLGCAAFVAVPSEFDRFPSWFVGGFGLIVAAFSLAVLPMVVRSVGKGGYLALTPEGIVTRGLGRSFVAWDDVVDVDVITVQRFQHLALKLRPGGKMVASWAFRSATRANRRLMGFDVGYAVNRYDLDATEVADLIRRCIEDPRERARLGSAPG